MLTIHLLAICLWIICCTIREKVKKGGWGYFTPPPLLPHQEVDEKFCVRNGVKESILPGIILLGREAVPPPFPLLIIGLTRYNIENSL